MSRSKIELDAAAACQGQPAPALEEYRGGRDGLGRGCYVLRRVVRDLPHLGYIVGQGDVPDFTKPRGKAPARNRRPAAKPAAKGPRKPRGAKTTGEAA